MNLINMIIKIYKFISGYFSHDTKISKWNFSYSIVHQIMNDFTGINWRLWTILQSWLCSHITVLLHGTILPRKTTSCSRVLRYFLVLRKCLFILNCRMSPGRTKHVCNLSWRSIISKLEKSLMNMASYVENFQVQFIRTG